MLSSPGAVFDGQERTIRQSRLLVILQVSIAIVLIGLMYGQVLADLALDWWNEPAYSQGMLIPPLALYIAWLRKSSTFVHPINPDNRALVLVAFACFTFLLGKLAVEFFLMRISFVILLAALTWTFWGLNRLRSLAFPFLLLSTMVPFPVIFYNALSAPLQLFASDVSARMAQALGVSVYRDGNIIQLANTSLGVAEACSGLNSLSALIVAGLLVGHLLCSRVITQIVVVVLSVPTAIGVNILRVTGTAILADYNPEFAMGFYHSFSGWLVFLVGFGVLYGFAKTAHALLD